jgi:hypothetical protein
MSCNRLTRITIVSHKGVTYSRMTPSKIVSQRVAAPALQPQATVLLLLLSATLRLLFSSGLARAISSAGVCTVQVISVSILTVQHMYHSA